MALVRMGGMGDFLDFEVSERGPDDDLTDDEVPTEIQVFLQLGELSAGIAVSGNYANGFADLVAYFDGLESNWRGWSGVRRWESLDHDLTIEARHDGHIQIKVEMKRQFWWTASGELTLEPGEQLSQLADDLRRAFAT